jgi:hypothetical protein
MLMRFASSISVISLVACVSPVQQAELQATGAAVRAGEPIAGHTQALEAWWPVGFADENQCIINGYQIGTDAFAQCVGTIMERESRPRRCTYCRSLN